MTTRKEIEMREEINREASNKIAAIQKEFHQEGGTPPLWQNQKRELIDRIGFVLETRSKKMLNAGIVDDIEIPELTGMGDLNFHAPCDDCTDDYPYSVVSDMQYRGAEYFEAKAPSYGVMYDKGSVLSRNHGFSQSPYYGNPYQFILKAVDSDRFLVIAVKSGFQVCWHGLHSGSKNSSGDIFIHADQLVDIMPRKVIYD